jgi:hypothetical protein
MTAVWSPGMAKILAPASKSEILISGAFQLPGRVAMRPSAQLGKKAELHNK